MIRTGSYAETEKHNEIKHKNNEITLKARYYNKNTWKIRPLYGKKTFKNGRIKFFFKSFKFFFLLKTFDDFKNKQKTYKAKFFDM